MILWKFALLASVLGPSLFFQEPLDGIVRRDAAFALTAGPGLVMGFASLFPPEEREDRVSTYIAWLGIIGCILHAAWIVVMLGFVARGVPTKNPGFVIASAVASPFVIAHAFMTCRRVLSDRAYGAYLVGQVRHATEKRVPLAARLRAMASDQNIAMAILYAFVIVIVLVSLKRPSIVMKPDWVAAAGIFLLGAMSMTWLRAREGDFRIAARGGHRRLGRKLGWATWLLSVFVFALLVIKRAETGYELARPALLYAALVLAGIGAIVPVVPALFRNATWRSSCGLSAGGLVTGRRDREIFVAWHDMESIEVADWMNNPALFVVFRDPEALLRSVPREVAALARKQWDQSLKWSGAHLVVISSTCRGDLLDMVETLYAMGHLAGSRAR